MRLPEDVVIEAGTERDRQLIAEVAEVQRRERRADPGCRLRQHAAEHCHKV